MRHTKQYYPTEDALIVGIFVDFLVGSLVEVLVVSLVGLMQRRTSITWLYSRYVYLELWMIVKPNYILCSWTETTI